MGNQLRKLFEFLNLEKNKIISNRRKYLLRQANGMMIIKTL